MSKKKLRRRIARLERRVLVLEGNLSSGGRIVPESFVRDVMSAYLKPSPLPPPNPSLMGKQS